MSVYIEGMEMPTGDEMLCINIFPDGKVTSHFDLRCMPVAKAVPVPEHGRLGDLDKLEQMFVDIDNAPYSGFDGSEPFYSAEDAAQIIRLAPTIILADDPKEEACLI